MSYQAVDVDGVPTDEGRTWAYPQYVVTSAERRWRVCRALASDMSGGDEESIWFAARALSRSDIPTD